MTQLKVTNHENLRFKFQTILLGRHSSEILLILTGFLLLVSLILFIVTTNLVRSFLIFEILFFLPFFSYLIAIALLKRENSVQQKNHLLIMTIFAVFFQILILLTNPTLSDDIYRFYYEAKGIIHGVNPYITPIASFPPVLRDQYFSMVNNADVTSPYPPIALIIFTLLFLISVDPFIYRLSFSIIFIISIIVCYKLISPQNKWKIIIFAWNPLFHLEIANGSHFDILVVLIILFAIWTLKSGKQGISGLLFFIAFLIKIYPIFLISAFWKQLGKRGLIVFFVGFFSYALLVLLNPFLIQGLLVYLDTWYFNASVFWVLLELTKDFSLSKIIVGLIFLLFLVFVILKPQNDLQTSYRHAIIIIGALLLLQPVFHPWYLFWLFPFIIFDDRMNLSWILLSGTIIFSYHVYGLFDSVGIWVESNVFRLMEYLPFYFVLILETMRSNNIFPALRFNRTSDELNVTSLKK